MNGELKEKKYEGMESLTTAIIVCDRDLIIHYINPSTESIFEVSAKQAINNNISIFLKILTTFLKTSFKKLKHKKIATKSMNSLFKLIRKKPYV